MVRLTLISSLFISLVFIACQETEEGCLDLLSNNYNFQAVTECDSCCTYPSAILNFRVDYDTFLSRALIDTFFLDNGDSLILHDIQLAIGEFIFRGEDGPYRILEDLQVGSASIKDDYVRATLQIAYTIGSVRYTGDTDMISFSVGIDAAEVSTYGALDLIDQASQLDNLLDSMYVSDREEVAMLRMNLQLGDSIRQLTMSSQEALDLNYSVDKSNDIGEDVSYTLRLDLESLSDGLSSTLSNEEIESIIINRIADSITIE